MSFSNPSPRQAIIEVIFAGGLWGFGFVATQWALSTWNPQGVLLWRFAGALLLGEILHWFFKPGKNKRVPWRSDFKMAIPGGLLMGTFLLLQTIGLQYTSASKSGFITTLYVLFVPFLALLFFKRRFSAKVLFLTAIACCGTFFLMDLRLDTLSEQINKGDVWTLASAFLAACHILYIGRVTDRVANPFRFNNFQSLWCLIAVLPMALLGSSLQHHEVNNRALLGILIVAAACSVLGFFIQVRSQKVLSDTTASMLFLLESPYAFFFAYFLMGDRLNATQGLGAALIFAAALGTVVVEQHALTNKKRTESPPLRPGR